MSSLRLTSAPNTTALRRRRPAWTLWLLAAAVLATSAAWGQGMPSLLDQSSTQVAVGGNHSCGLTTTSAVTCWGDNANGQASVPVALQTGGAVTIATGYHHSCALTTTGAVTCWGDNANGQASVPAALQTGGAAAITAGVLHSCALTSAGALQCWGDSSAFSGDPLPASGVAAIAAGHNHTCALTTAGAVQCWGGNSNGQTSVPAALQTSGATAIAAGGVHTCALTNAGAVQCWGGNSNGQTGVPVALQTSGATAIAAGETHTCALTTAGAVQCWGATGNDYGQATVPVALQSGGAAAIAAGPYHTCALSVAGAVRCWGDNTFGRATVPGALASVPETVAPGGRHTCALTTAGAVKCWGDNYAGQLGTPSNAGIDNPNPTPLDVTGLGSGVAAITAGSSHTCALTTAGAVKCWGLNHDGQLGTPANAGTYNPNPTPLDVTGLGSGVTAIAASGLHTCALTTTGAVKCWGMNFYGQLGSPANNGTSTANPAPLNVTNLGSGVAAITAGDYHTCALTTAGALKCWGLNRYGQLGNPASSGTQNPNPTPLDVTNLGSGGAAIAAGNLHTCALTTVGALKCWGWNQYGQLGNPANSGTNAANQTPLDVTGLGNGVAAIATGDLHTCALTAAGALRCWGRNTDGQLGNPANAGADNPNPTPLEVTNFSGGAAAIAAGTFHTCALTTAGALRCWSRNDRGQLGNGNTTDGSATVRLGQSLAFAPGAAGSPLHTVAAGASLPLGATASGGGSVPIVYDVWTPQTCSVSGNTLTATAAGLCGVRASRAGGSDGNNGTTSAAPQQLRLLQVTRAAPTLALASSAEPAGVGTSVTFSATLANQGPPTGLGTATFCADAVTVDTTCGGTAPLCMVAADAVTVTCTSSGLAAGSHAIAVYFSGDANNDAAVSATLNQRIGSTPAISSSAATTFAYGIAASFTVTASGPPAPTLTLDPADFLPSGISFADQGDGTAILSGASSAPGAYTLYVTAQNLIGSDSQTFTLTVLQAVQATPQSVDVPFNTARTITLSGSDPNGPYPLTYAIASPPAHGTIGSFDASAGTLTYTPAAGYSGADGFTFTAATQSGTSSPASVDLSVLQPQFTLAFEDHHDFARYGQVIDYSVTVTNTGEVASAVPVTFTLSSAFDGQYVTIVCRDGGIGAVCTQDPGNPLRYIVTLPANRSLSLDVRVPVLAVTDETTVELDVSNGLSTATDVRTLVVFKDGYDVPYGDGTQSLPPIEGAQAKAILDGDALQAIPLPTQPASTAMPLLIVRDGEREVRVECVTDNGHLRVRLLARDVQGSERATAWSGVEAGATLILGSMVSGESARALVLEGAQLPLVLY